MSRRKDLREKPEIEWNILSKIKHYFLRWLKSTSKVDFENAKPQYELGKLKLICGLKPFHWISTKISKINIKVEKNKQFNHNLKLYENKTIIWVN